MSEELIFLLVIFGFVFLVILLGVVAVAASVWWTARHKAHREEREAALKQDMLDRGLSVEEIERLLRATAAEQPAKSSSVANDDAEIVEEFASLLGACKKASPVAIEEIFALVRAADSATKRMMLSAVTGMRDSFEEQDEQISDEQVRAVVRALSRPPESVPSASDLPPLTDMDSRIAEAIRLVDRPGV